MKPDSDDEMRPEYDFSEAVRGKFYRPESRRRIPVYLDMDTLMFVQAIAEKKKTDADSVVNELIRATMRLGEVIR